MLLTGAAGLKPRRKPSYYAKVSVAKVGRVVGAVGGSAGRDLQQKMRGRVASQDWLDASETMRGTFRLVIAEDLSSSLPAVRAPTLLVWGEADEETPLWMGERMVELLPDGALVKLPGGHYVYAERSAEFNRIAAHFLTEARPEPSRGDADRAAAGLGRRRSAWRGAGCTCCCRCSSRSTTRTRGCMSGCTASAAACGPRSSTPCGWPRS